MVSALPSKPFGPMRRKPLPRFAALVLLFLLVAAETLTTAHALDLDAHSGGDPCKICISVAGLDTALPAKAVPFDLARTHTRVGIAHERPVPTLRAVLPSARGPPLAS
jgi:hypothetical protein